MSCSPWGRKESDTTEQLHFHFSLSCIGEGNDNPLQCSCLENPRDSRAWWASIYGVAQSWTKLKRCSSSKAFACVDHNKLCKILQEMGIPDHLTCFLRNLYTGQDATVRTGHGITDWFQIRKGVHQGCILSPCLFNLYAEYIMQNARLVEVHTRIKIFGRNINNLRYADNTTLMTEDEEELKSLSMKVKEESEKVGLKLNIEKANIMAS